jgi:hypothetical protein
MGKFLFVEIVGVDLCVFFPLFGHFSFIVNGIHRASGHACAAIDANAWVNIEHRILVIALNAVDGAHIDARFVLYGDAGLANNVGQGRPPGCVVTLELSS